MAKRILLVDDEPLILKPLKYQLEMDGYETELAMDGEEALEKFFSRPFDFVLLDVMLPKLDGLSVCQRIRERSNVPIIMLTAKGEDMDKILGLEYGADDYMTKPFNTLEVRTRIRTVLRRVAAAQSPEDKKILRVREMEVNLIKRTVMLAGEEIKLTAKEFDLLQLLMTNRGRPYTRKEILDAVWKDPFASERTVDVHVRRLREKVEHDTAHPFYILTEWKVGYKFTDVD
ncbi:MAG: response regulator transcription factor [Clostridia bacterium]|nr:response regulator transcription factor [Clostridia bacterium]